MTVNVDRLPLRDISQEPIEVKKPLAQVEQIRLHFEIALENGDIVDSNFDRAPVVFCPGDGNLPQAFENVVLAMKQGEKRTVKLEPEQTFGQPKEENMQIIPVYSFPADLALEQGLVIAFSDNKGNEQAGVIRSIGKQSVEVDFNHPLAGKHLLFTVEIIERSRSGDENE